MKEKGSDHSRVEGDQLVDHEVWPAAAPERNLEGRGRPKWYDMLPYERFVQYLPRLRYLRGSKARFTITTFDEIHKVCQQIFECNKSFFRFRSQVDLLAHYIGTKILEQVYIVRGDREKNPLSQLLEDQEKQFELWDQMKCVKDTFQSLCEKFMEGFITRKELYSQVDRYIETFSTKDDREKMEKVINLMLENGAFGKAKERNRKNDYNRKRAIEKGIHEVK